MDRAEAAGAGVAIAGHAALLAALTLGLAVRPALAPDEQAMEVSFVDEVALSASAPQPSTAPAPSAPAPEPTPRLAVLTPVAEPSPAPAPRRSRPRPPTPGPLSWNPESFGPPPGPRSDSPSARQPAPMSGQAAADIASAINRQVQPCADRQVYPGPGSERILTPIILSLNRDGSLRGRPRVGAQTGLDDENRRYAQRVADLAVNAFMSCSPLRGLPQELYDVPRGWSNFTMRYRLPG